jgi:hypothetical protein
MANERSIDRGRRRFFGAAGSFAALSVLGDTGATAMGFTPSELSELNAAVLAIEIQGARLPAGVLAMSGVEAPPRT